MAKTRLWLMTALAFVVCRTAMAQSLDFQFYRTRVEPIFLKVREANGPGGSCFMCHTHVNTRFRLEPVSSSLAWTEEQSRRNFQAAMRLVVPGDPAKSRLLTYPLAAAAGGDPIHAGGKQWASQEDPEWQTLAAWVRTGSVAAVAPAIQMLSFEVFRNRIEPILLKKREGLARCYVCHSQGTNFRLQPLSPGATNWTEAQSRLNFEAARRVVVPGDPSTSRLLMMPLATEAGGDPFHPGGKHWRSQNDGEWKQIAEWVRGN
jgi:hypothetical protein